MKRSFLYSLLLLMLPLFSFAAKQVWADPSAVNGQPATQTNDLNPKLVPCVNVIYATDRKPGGKDFANKADKKIHWGQSKVFLQLEYRRNKNPDSKWLEFVSPEGLQVPGVSIVTGTQETTNEFLKTEKSDKTFAFIHGFGTSFENGAIRAAKIAYDLQLSGTPILYSWPSRDSISVSGYRGDTATVEGGEEISRCVGFLEDVLAHSASNRVDLVAHSMGTHLLCEALAKIDPKFIRKVGSIVLIAPDISANDFKRLYLQEDGLQSRCVLRGHPILVYANEHDQALRLSQFLTDERRLGQGGSKATILDELTFIDCTRVAIDWGSNHELDQHDPVIDDMYLWLRQDIRPSHRLLTLVPKDGGGYYESFAGVKSIKRPTDYAYMLAGQFGDLDDVFKFGLLSDDRHWQLEGGIDKGFLASQVDLRLNVLTDSCGPIFFADMPFTDPTRAEPPSD